MNTNEIRFYMHSYHGLEKDIAELRESLNEYRKMRGIGAQIITDMPIYHSGESKTESEAIDRMTRIHDKIVSIEDKLDVKQTVFNAINSVYYYLDEPARSIIEMRYFITPMVNDVRKPKYSWQYIAIEVKYSEDYCKEIDCKVIRRIQEEMFK